MAKVDIYAQVTERVLEMMETHGSDWINPFSRKGQGGQPRNIASKKAYRGINIILLGWSGHTSATWGTYKQWSERKCQVRKGEKSTQILFWQFFKKKDEAGNEVSIPMLRTYFVFNADQVDGDIAEAIQSPATNDDGATEIVSAEEFFRHIPAAVTYSDVGKAYYSPTTDRVHMPNKGVFEATPTSTASECFYSTLAHELVHWTGHKSRLDRDLANGFGSEDYAREELVAELGAAFLCATLDISASPRADHAKYLNGWMKKLSDHKREFVSAASAATKAVDYLVNAAQPQAMAA